MESVARYRNDADTEEIAIYSDTDAHDMLGDEDWFTFVFSTSYRYDLGHKQVSSDELEELVSEAKASGATVLPVYIEDHGGVAVSVGTSEWDGHPGAIIITEAGCNEIGITSEAAIEQVQAIIEDYNEWLAGEVYGYIRYDVTRCNLGHEHTTRTEDSCWGFIGSDHKEILEESGVTIGKGWRQLPDVDPIELDD